MEYEDAARYADEVLGEHPHFLNEYHKLGEAYPPLKYVHEDLWKLFQLAFYAGAHQGLREIEKGLDDGGKTD
jgi:hypothetical protein